MIARLWSTRWIRNIDDEYHMTLGWILGLNPPAIVMKVVVVAEILEMLSRQM